MEDLYGLKYAETEESVTADKRRNEGCTDRTVQTDFDNTQRGAVQCVWTIVNKVDRKNRKIK